MFRVSTFAAVVLVLFSIGSVQSQEATTTCIFGGRRMPCTIETHIKGEQTISLQPIKKSDWEFHEKDMDRVATALQAELLNNVTIENAQAFVMSQLYRQYRGNQVQKLLGYLALQILREMKAKYPDLDDGELLEAIVIEAGLPVIKVPSAAEDVDMDEIRELLLGSGILEKMQRRLGQ